jgi:anion-transporting  ArsA/GET3 family ATPase
MNQLLDTRMRIVTGKGGVGKSTVALAMALIAARRGKRVLLCEVNPSESITRFFAGVALTGVPEVVLPGITMVALIPAEAMREYGLLMLKFKTLYNAVFENRIVRYFLRAVPSLGEFVMLGKLWYHEQEKRNDGTPLYDTIIVDAPATGHLVSWLRVPQVFDEMMPAGPIKSSAGDMLAMLRDPRRAMLDIVLVPEEMPVNEAVELEQAAEHYRLATRGFTIINKVSPTLPEGLGAALEQATPSSADAPILLPLLEALHTREHWRALGERYLQRLPAEALRDAIRLSRRTLPITTKEGVEALSRELEAAT